MSKPKTIWVGVIPGIFGYGISVASDSEANAMGALRLAYAEWKAGRPDPDTNFESSFDSWGGQVFEVELNKSYYDNFGS
jgi:hypothetical protein